MQLKGCGLSAKRRGLFIFRNLEFCIKGGDVLVITGLNGSGKSTFLRAIAGLFSLSEGVVDFKGTQEFSNIRSACHYIGHENGMKHALTVQENLNFWKKFIGSKGLCIQDALGHFGLEHTENIFFHSLSEGQRRRVCLSRLLVSYRPVWLLDEPLAGLDGRSQARFFSLIEEHRQTGGIVIMATHPPFFPDNIIPLTIEKAS